MSTEQVTPQADFSNAGVALIEWLGAEPHEATIKAAEQALAIPGEPFVVAIFGDGPAHSPAHKFAAQQRRALTLWLHSNHPNKQGRVRCNTQTRQHPTTGVSVKVVVITYDLKKGRVPDAAI